MRIILSFILIISISLLSAQNFQDLYPEVTLLELSAEGEKAFQKHQKRCEEIWATDSDSLSEEDQEYMSTCSEVVTSYWEIIDGGCSWYCGGGPKEVTASSYLASQGKYSYNAENAHDLDYQQVWVEGVKGYGIGEYLLYRFEPTSPRITEIAVANGHVKSENTWRNNSRVKTLKMYLNDEPYALLHLEDKRSVQHFKVEPIGVERGKSTNWEELKKQSEWTMKFEIADVYPGAKYDDVVISEIFFDGIDVHCLAKGTMIQMADQSQQKIETLAAGDKVLSYNPQKDIFEADQIIEVASPIHKDLIEIQFNDGSSLTLTQDHPLQTENGDWVSFDPQKTLLDYQFDQVDQLQSGISLKTVNGQSKIEEIKVLSYTQPTFTIVKLKKNKIFIANGILVGTEPLRDHHLSAHP